MTTWRLPRIEHWFLRAGLFLLPLAFWWDTYDHYVLPKVVARVLVLGLLILYVARSGQGCRTPAPRASPSAQ